MKAITLRNVPDELAAVIQTEAARTNTSLNATVIRLLQKATNKPAGQSTKKRDLSDLAGSWTKDEADEFDRALAEQRRILPEEWR